MPANKKQHFVPQFYLKNFADDFNRKSIGLFHLDSKQVHQSVSIRSQCQEDYFYSKSLVFEKAVKIIEDFTAPVISEVLTTNKFPSNDKWISILLPFIASLYGRTKVQKDVIDSFFTIVGESVLEANREQFPIKDYSFSDFKKNYNLSFIEPAIKAHNTTFLSFPILLDLEAVLLCNKTYEGFVTSDNPIVFYNKLYENCKSYATTGMSHLGLKIFFPISSDKLLMLYDPKIYKLKAKNRLIEISKIEDVREINKLQWLNADNNLYFYPSSDECLQVRCGSNKFIRFRQPNNKITSSENSSKGQIERLIYSSKVNFNCKLRLSFVRFKNGINQDLLPMKPIARSLLWAEIVEEFIGLVEKSLLTFGEFPKFLDKKSLDYYSLGISHWCVPLAKI